MHSSSGACLLTLAQAIMRLFAKEVMPELRKLGDDPLFDTEAAAPPAFMAA